MKLDSQAGPQLATYVRYNVLPQRDWLKSELGLELASDKIEQIHKMDDPSNLSELGRLAAAVIVMRLVDLFWLIAPGFRPESIGVHWMDLAAPVGLGGIWLAFFAGQLKQRPLLPIGDPNLEQALSRGEH